MQLHNYVVFSDIGSTKRTERQQVPSKHYIRLDTAITFTPQYELQWPEKNLKFVSNLIKVVC